VRNIYANRSPSLIGGMVLLPDGPATPASAGGNSTLPPGTVSTLSGPSGSSYPLVGHYPDGNQHTPDGNQHTGQITTG
jgi:hypothetical protein